MLYVTTRNRQDAVTVNHVLSESRGADGGLFVPLHFPRLSAQDLKKLSGVSFGTCVAGMLNLFFSKKLTGWDIDFCIGRYPVRLESLVHKIHMAETWHNPEWKYHRLEKNLRDLLQIEAAESGSWVSVAVRMAVLAAVLSDPKISNAGPVDISAVSGDFITPISAFYLRKMGFSIGNIICCCNENNQFWDLLCNGQMRTDGTCLSTLVPEADVTVPEHLERLIAAYGGILEVERYLDCCRTGTIYVVPDHLLHQLRQNLYASVISSMRVETTIPNVYKTHGCILSPASALAYSGLLDYRAKTGIARTAVVICDKNPICDADTVSKVMGIPVAELQKLI